MGFLVLEDVLEDLARAVIPQVSAKLDALVIARDGPLFSAVIVRQYRLHIRADVHLVEVADNGLSLEEEKALDVGFGVFHLLDGAFLDRPGELLVTPIVAHLSVHNILADGGQLIGEQKI